MGSKKNKMDEKSKLGNKVIDISAARKRAKIDASRVKSGPGKLKSNIYFWLQFIVFLFFVFQLMSKCGM